MREARWKVTVLVWIEPSTSENSVTVFNYNMADWRHTVPAFTHLHYNFIQIVWMLYLFSLTTCYKSLKMRVGSDFELSFRGTDNMYCLRKIMLILFRWKCLWVHNNCTEDMNSFQVNLTQSFYGFWTNMHWKATVAIIL